MRVYATVSSLENRRDKNQKDVQLRKSTCISQWHRCQEISSRGRGFQIPEGRHTTIQRGTVGVSIRYGEKIRFTAFQSPLLKASAVQEEGRLSKQSSFQWKMFLVFLQQPGVMCFYIRCRVRLNCTNSLTIGKSC